MTIEEFIEARLEEASRPAMGTQTEAVVRALCALGELHFDAGDHGVHYCGTCHDYDRHDAEPWPCMTARTIAAIWSDHPDYRQEWDAER
ncbi:hypothetical protein [Nocardia nova]